MIEQDVFHPADFKRCGVGEEEWCCAFMVVGADGPECAWGTSLERTIRDRVASGAFSAKWMPTKSEYPHCQDERIAAAP